MAGSALVLSWMLAEGCALGGMLVPSGNAPTRGKLSDAAEQAKKPPEQQDPPPSGDTEETELSSTKSKQGDDGTDDAAGDAGGDEIIVVPAQLDAGGDEIVVVPAQLDGGAVIATVDAVADTAESPLSRDRIFFGPVAGWEFDNGEVFERLRAFGAQLGGGRPGGRERLTFEIVHARLRVKEGHALHDAVHDVTELGFGGTARFHLTPSHTLVGAYVLAGYRLAIVEWKWQNPVAGEDSDSISTHSVYLGLGVLPVQTRHVHLGANFSGGLRIFENATSSGYENDLFGDVWFGRLVLEAMLVS